MRQSKSQGFTLLEVMVAVAIMAVGVAIAMSIFSGGLKNIYRIDMAHRAMSHAENVMNELLSDQSIREPQHFAAELDDDFRYTATVDYWEEPQERLSIDTTQVPVYLLTVQVEVHFKNDRFGKLYRASCLKAVPQTQADQGLAPGSDAIRRLFGGNP